MRLLLDQGVPRGASVCLRDFGYECEHVGDIGMSKSTDREILDRASQEGAIVITLDADFHAIQALAGARFPSVVRIRIEGLNAGDVASVVSQTIARFEAELKNGALITVKENRIACRNLPIRGI